MPAIKKSYNEILSTVETEKNKIPRIKFTHRSTRVLH